MIRRRRRRSKGFKVTLFIILVICAVIIFRQEYKIYKLKKEQEATQQHIEQLEKEKAELEAERKRLDDTHYIEKLAREDYNMVGKDEVPIFIVEEDGKKNTQNAAGNRKTK